MNPYAIIAALVIWIGTGAGAWLYRAHIDSQDVTDAQNAVAAASAKVAEASQLAAAKATQSSQEQADARALTLQKMIDDQRKSYESQLAKSRAALRNLPSCPVPDSAVGMLISSPAATGSGSGGAQKDPGPVSGGSASGTVDASSLIASCESNRAAFDRNLWRLNSCIASYDAARAEVNK
jgi:hypothetical protein